MLPSKFLSCSKLSLPSVCFRCVLSLVSVCGEVWVSISFAADAFIYASFLLFPQNIQDLSIVTCCVPLIGGSDISPRLLKHFSVLVMPHPPQSALCSIFQVIYPVNLLGEKKIPKYKKKKCKDSMPLTWEHRPPKEIHFIFPSILCPIVVHVQYANPRILFP